MSGFSPDHSWFVARCRPGRELIAEAHLQHAGFDETFCPVRVSSITHHNRTFEHFIAVYSGYVFCKTFAFTPFLWHDACPTDDRPKHGLITGFLGGWPADPVPDESVADMRERCEGNIWLAPPEPEPLRFVEGDHVRVLDGAWSGHVFTVVFDYGHKVSVKGSLQTGIDRLYIARERVEPIAAAPEPSVRALHKPTRRSRRAGRKVRSVPKIQETALKREATG